MKALKRSIWREAQAARLTAGGTSNVILVNNPSALVTADGSGTKWTIIQWLSSPDNAAGSDFASIYHERTAAGGQDTTLQWKQSGAIAFFHRPQGFGNPTASITSAPGFDDDAWHCVAIAKRADNDYELYVDFVSQGTNTTSVTLPYLTKGDTGVSNINAGQSLPSGARFGPLITFARGLTIQEIRQAAYGRIESLRPHLALGVWESGVYRDMSDHKFDAYKTGSNMMPCGGPPGVRFALSSRARRQVATQITNTMFFAHQF